MGWITSPYMRRGCDDGSVKLSRKISAPRQVGASAAAHHPQYDPPPGVIQLERAPHSVIAMRADKLCPEVENVTI